MDSGYLFTTLDGRIGRADWWKGFVGLLVLQFISWLLFGDDGLLAFVGERAPVAGRACAAPEAAS